MSASQALAHALDAAKLGRDELSALVDEVKEAEHKAADLRAEIIELEARAKTLGPDMDERARVLDKRITDFDLNSTRKKRAADEREGELIKREQDVADRKEMNAVNAQRLTERATAIDQQEATVKAAEAALEQRKARMAAA